ncbi:MAG: response regulator [Myxococcales bacterium]|nr:response regulator [Myxococcales bacterium]
MTDATNPVILVADDDPEILSLLSIRLKKAGFEVVEASDGEETLAKVREHYPDLVVLDVMMPGKNGWEVAKELRADDRFKKMGIVMLTAIGEKINEMTSPLYGADEFIDKPFEFADLENKIRATLEKRKSG